MPTFSQWQESDLEQKMTATSGHICCEQYARYSPLGSLARTLLGSSRWYSPARSLKWVVKPLYSMRVTERERNNLTQSKKSAKVLNVRDIQSNRLLFQLVPLVRPTGGTEYGLLPTVQTQGLKVCNKDGKTEFLSLDLLLTPSASDGLRAGMSMESLKSHKKKNDRAEQFSGTDSPQGWWRNFPTQSPICGRDDGLSLGLVNITFPKWRAESVKALGNAIVPQVIYEIFKAIEDYGNRKIKAYKGFNSA